ncbi:MAG: TonB-dependent receptor, partial [Thermoanaerobaculia bacterium]
MSRSLNFKLTGRVLALGVVLALVAGGVAFAQPTGNIYVTTVDTEGARLPGVTVTVSGMGAPMIFVTDAQGEIRFLGLDPGMHQIKSELEGFGTVEHPNVEVRIGRNTAIEVTMSAAIEEVITVTSESPLLDERRLSTGTTVTAVELEKIPTARDPWAIMSQTPGVILDRINVGGNESGQQSSFRSQGVSSQQNDFLIDGVQITDMSALGASPSYYDFDQFAEIALTTGGNDVTKNVAGLSVNMVTKRGTNEFRGSARFFKTQARGYFGGALPQSDLNVADEICTTGCTTAQDPDDYVGSQLNGVEDIGFEAGGPAYRDKVWLWGSWAKNDIRTIAA